MKLLQIGRVSMTYYKNVEKVVSNVAVAIIRP